jgi:hypothetical protein
MKHISEELHCIIWQKKYNSKTEDSAIIEIEPKQPGCRKQKSFRAASGVDDDG